MKISIAMCTYNGSRYLEQQLDSIHMQTRQPGELVICDDGSTDDTEALVNKFQASVSFPVHFHKNPVNLRSTKNFEKAISLCQGELIALCDQDDVWFPEKLESMHAVFAAETAVAGVFSNARLIDETGNFVADDLWHRAGFTAARQATFKAKQTAYQLIDRDTVTGAAFMFRAKYVSQVLPISAEWIHDGWIAMILASLADLRPLPAYLMSYRLHVQQQVGVKQIAWYTHLSTQKQDALASHRQLARRLSDMALKLDSLQVEAGITEAVYKKVRFLKTRAEALGQPRLGRTAKVIGLLPGYFRYQKGIMSLLRDLAH